MRSLLEMLDTGEENRRKKLWDALNDETKIVQMTNLVNLLQACESGDCKTVRRLLKKGVNVNSNEDNLSSPLEVAMRNNQVNIVQMLLARPETKLRMENNMGNNPLL